MEIFPNAKSLTWPKVKRKLQRVLPFELSHERWLETSQADKSVPEKWSSYVKAWIFFPFID